MKSISSWHVGVAAEAFAAAVFARYGYDVSVQYGANQPEYDLIAVSGDRMLKLSVKGTMRSLRPLPNSFTSFDWKSISPTHNAAASDIRAPLA